MSARAVRTAAAMAGAAFLLSSSALAQDRPQPPAARDQKPPPTVEEVGGRLVVSGDAVFVVADPDQPPRDASIATKTETPLRETPRSVSVTDRQTLDDRLAVNVSNAHDYTVGVVPADERGPAFARGFTVSFYDLRRDGLRTYAWSVREPVAVERVQYLRGPASVLYGDGSPGALVNMVLRKPLPVARRELTASGGALGFGRVTGDVTGPVGGSRRARYRLIGAAEWLGNGIDNGERRLSLLPMASFDVGARATLHVDAELYHQRGRNYRHTVPTTAGTQRGDFSTIPWSFSTASPDDRWTGWNVSPGARVDVQLNRSTSLHSAFRYTRIGGDIDGQGLAGLAADGRTVNRFDYLERSTWQEWQSDSFAATTAVTGPVEHRLVFGVEAGLSTADSEIGIGAGTPVDLYDPVYAPSPAPPALRPTRYDVARLGAYAQDQMRVHPSIVIVPGVRWSRLDVEDRASAAAASAERTSSDVKLSPSIGLVVMPRRWLSVYASASQGFEPPAPGQYLEDGRALSVAESTAVEGGVKFGALGGRLEATTAVFGITRTNIPEADGRGFYRQIGEGRSHGIESDVTGRAAPGLFIQAAYAWTDTEVTESVAGSEGNELPNAPHHNASLWSRYQFRDGALAGATVGAGVVHVSDRFIAGNNIVIAPGYTRLDLSGSYELRRRHARISLALRNATGRKYVMSGAGQALFAAPPRQVVVQVTTWF